MIHDHVFLFFVLSGSLEVEEMGQLDKVSGGSGGSGDTSVNGDRTTTGEKKREGNIVLSVEEIRTSKGSRRTTSLLNLFIPLSQGMFKAKGYVLHPMHYLSLQSSL